MYTRSTRRSLRAWSASVVLATVATASLALAGSAAAGEYCVPDTSIAASCNFSAATPQIAIDWALGTVGEDTVRLGAGTYAAGILATGSSVEIIGAGQGATTIEGSAGSASVVRLNGNLTIRDLTIRATSGDDYALRLGGGASASSVTVERTGTANGVAARIDGGSEEPELSNSTVRVLTGSEYPVAVYSASLENSAVTIGGSASPLFGVYSSNSTFSRMRVQGNVQDAAVYMTAGGDITDSVLQPTSVNATALSVITSGADTTATIRDSSLIGPVGSITPALRVSVYNPGLTATLTATGIAADGFAGIGCSATGNNAGSTARFFVSYSVNSNGGLGPCVDRTDPNLGSEQFTPIGGLITASPGFTNAATGDVRLTPDSPAIDHGDPTPLSADPLRLDFYGLAREVDGSGDGVVRRDAGASEYVIPVVTPPAGPGPLPLPTPPPGRTTPTETPRQVDPKPTKPSVLSVKRSGRFTAPSSRAKGNLLKTTKPSSKKGSKAPGRLTVKLNAAPATVRFTLQKRTINRKTKKPRYVKLKGSESVKATSTTLVLRLSGRWAGKQRIKPGTYRLTASSAKGSDSQSVTFTVR